jgi:hypothetical protein
VPVEPRAAGVTRARAAPATAVAVGLEVEPVGEGTAQVGKRRLGHQSFAERRRPDRAAQAQTVAAGGEGELLQPAVGRQRVQGARRRELSVLRHRDGWSRITTPTSLVFGKPSKSANP